jgi:hypothetical protein
MLKQMNGRMVAALLLVVSTFAFTSQSHATVMTPENGDFEANAVSTESYGYFIDLTTTPTGWRQADFSYTDGDHEIAGILHRPGGDIAQGQTPLYAAPVNGSNQLFGLELDWDGLSTYSTHTGIYQDLGTMSANEKYTFNATLYSNGEGSRSSYRISFFDVTDNRELAAITQANFDPSAKGILQNIDATFNYTATAAESGDTLRIVLLGTPGAGNHVRTGIDAVTVTTSTVPEPNTIALCMTGALGLLAFAWRKRK